ncbi:hypothetical protein M0R45_021720 [Rubus argutus]|uniref:Uncharacterized protein n=1 Tax=Rubus argutus TaxID=59490 RepID=A0AAW1XC58_RUBAR
MELSSDEADNVIANPREFISVFKSPQSKSCSNLSLPKPIEEETPTVVDFLTTILFEPDGAAADSNRGAFVVVVVVVVSGGEQEEVLELGPSLRQIRSGVLLD